MPDLLGQIKRKAAHRKKEKLKLTYHIVVYSITGAPRNLQAAAFTIERGDHAFESTTATQARAHAGAVRRCTRRCAAGARVRGRCGVLHAARCAAWRAGRIFDRSGPRKRLALSLESGLH